MFTSTSPLLLFRPIEIRDCRIMYSKSLPSKRAIATPFGSGLQARLAGLDGADLPVRANKAQASLSEGCCTADITRRLVHQNGEARKKTIHLVPCCLHLMTTHNAVRHRNTHGTASRCDHGRQKQKKYNHDNSNMQYNHNDTK